MRPLAIQQSIVLRAQLMIIGKLVLNMLGNSIRARTALLSIQIVLRRRYHDIVESKARRDRMPYHFEKGGLYRRWECVHNGLGGTLHDPPFREDAVGFVIIDETVCRGVLRRRVSLLIVPFGKPMNVPPAHTFFGQQQSNSYS